MSINKQQHTKECSALTRLFDKVYIINLVHRTDRKQEMAVELKKIHLQIDSPNVYLFPAVTPDNYEGWPSKGAKGCFMSHLGVLNDALVNRYQRILIIEDDLNFTDGFEASLGQLEATLNLFPWHIFYGGYELLAAERDVLTVIPASLTDTSGVSINEGLFTTSPSTSIRTTHFVGFSGEVIKELVTYLTAMMERPAGHPDGGPMHVDGAYSWFRREHPEFITLMASPQLGYQRSSETDIADKKWFDTWPLVSNLVRLARKIKNLAHAR